MAARWPLRPGPVCTRAAIDPSSSIPALSQTRGWEAQKPVGSRLNDANPRSQGLPDVWALRHLMGSQALRHLPQTLQQRSSATDFLGIWEHDVLKCPLLNTTKGTDAKSWYLEDYLKSDLRPTLAQLVTFYSLTYAKC